ncbi:MAG: ABC transporter substrate-binding protein [Acidimicrobiia bacterium]|nr:MAG: ABC transporter substrate-binding protein [Acidimicrobiia bacterium]
MGKTSVRLLILVTSFALVVAACGGGEADSPTTTAEGTGGTTATTSGTPDTQPPAQSGGEVVIAIGAEPSTLDPQLRDEGAMLAVNGNIYETLVTRTPEGDLTPSLATDLGTILDDTTWQFKLRDDVTFQNGEAFNADAVVASVNRIIDPDYGSEQISNFETIVGAEKIDDVTVNILTSGPDPILPARMTLMHMVPALASGDESFADSPVGSGPYKFVKWDRGSEIVLAANEDYWGGRPAVDGVTFRFIEEAGTRLAGVLAGEVDLTISLAPEDFDRVPQSFAVKGVQHVGIILNTRPGSPIGDVRIRQALNYAVDKEAIVSALFSGFAGVDPGQFVNESWFGFNPNLEAYPYDPDKARALLEEAGATGMTIPLVGVSGRLLKDRETVEAVAGYWEAVGLKVDLQILEFSAFLDRFFDRENRPVTNYIIHENTLFDADRTVTLYYHKDGAASSNADDEISAWIDEARTELDPVRRLQLYNDVLQKGYDEAMFVFLANQQDTYGASERLIWAPRVDGKILAKDMALNP